MIPRRIDIENPLSERRTYAKKAEVAERLRQASEDLTGTTQ